MPLNILMMSNSPYLRKGMFSNETYLWHFQLGHINHNIIHDLVSSGILNSLILEAIPVCELCLEGKMTKRPFKPKGNRAAKRLGLVHTDVCGLSVQARGEYGYSSHLLMTTQDMNMFT